VWNVRDIRLMDAEIGRKCTILFKYGAHYFWSKDTNHTKIVAVECVVRMHSKIHPIKSYIQPRRHKNLQIKRRKLLIDRSQTYILLRTWASCAGRHCQDNIHTQIEIQRRWHTVLQIMGLGYRPFVAVKLTPLVVKMCVVADVNLQENP